MMELAKSEMNIEVTQIGNTGSRCQFPVYKVRVLDKEFMATPAKRQVTYIYEMNLRGLIKRNVIEIENGELIDWLLKKIDDFLSGPVNTPKARTLQGGKV